MAVAAAVPATVSNVSWTVGAPALASIARLKTLFAHTYDDEIRSLKEFLCSYFNGGNKDCTRKECGVCPIKAGVAGAKAFKVRWVYPGCGKSGGLRLGILVYCDQRRVVVALVEKRAADPPMAKFQEAFKASVR